MRMYAHDYVWGVQDRREISPAPGAELLAFLIDCATRAAKRLGTGQCGRRRVQALEASECLKPVELMYMNHHSHVLA